ncbi:MAG: hypothetical protein JNL74_09460 [Fibrobacteres bacterium]|nr:hypothetical protein [Fibrobacterota bacterium]
MLDISHIGEEIFADIITHSPACFALFRLQNTSWLALPNIQLTSCGNYRFDGAHKLDIGILDISKKECVAIELKLGKDRLSASQIDRRFLCNCGTSHNNSRISGNMMAILERKLPDQCKSCEIEISVEEELYTLSKRWFFVCRQQVVDSWTVSKPSLSENCTIITAESIIEKLGDKSIFNDIVKSHIDFDYYEKWIA